MAFVRSSFCLLFIFLCSYSAAHAQGSNPGVHTETPFGSFSGSDIDHVDMSNGALSMRIPLYSVPLKNSKLNASFSLLVDGSMRFTPTAYCNPSGSGCTYTYNLANDYPGPQIVFDQGFGAIAQSSSDNYMELYGYYDDVPIQESMQEISYAYYISDATGAHHNLAFDSTSDHMTLRTIDGSGYSLTLPTPTTYQAVLTQDYLTLLGDAYDANGSHWHRVSDSSSQFIDSNGNVLVTSSTDQNNVNHIIDLFNRNLIVYESSQPGLVSLCPNDFVDSTQPTVGARYVDFPGPSDTNGIIQLLVCYTTFNIHTDLLGADGNDAIYNRTNVVTQSGPATDTYKEVALPLSAIQSIVYPDKTYLSFKYDAVHPNAQPSIAYGNITSVHLRTGAVISYSQQPTETCASHTDPFHGWGGDQPPYEAFHSSVFARTVTSDGQSHPWNYYYDDFGGSTTTVESKPDGNSTKYTFLTMDTQCTAYETERQEYDGAAPTRINPSTNGVLLRTTDTSYYQFQDISGISWESWLNGETSTVAFPHTITTTPAGGNSTTTTYVYDGGFEGDQPFQLQQGGSSPYWTTRTASEIWGIPKNVTVAGPDGNGGSLTSTKTTDYKWETAGPTLSANLLDTPSIVSVSGSGGNSATTTFTYDAYGNETLRTITGPQGGTHSVSTQYNSDGQPTQVIDNMEIDYAYEDPLSPFPSKITYPQVNGVPHVEHFTWDHNTSQIASFTDQNSILATYQYHGPLAQLTQEVDASGTSAQTSTSFDYSNPVSPVARKDLHSFGDGLLVTTTVLDGLGRPTKVTRPDGSVVDTTYDSVGNVHSVSNPYYASDGPGGGKAFSYDGLNRKRTECYSDGNCEQWTPDGYVIMYTDESGVRWQRTSDALGRLANVVELGTTVAPLSLQATYTYDALGNLMSATQNGTAGETLRYRSFTYDSLSRLITSQNPETGTICYGQWNGGSCVGGYDGNGNLLHKTDANGTVSSFQYDSLNRVTSESYSDGITPDNFYAYDVAPGYMPDLQKTIGRLTYSGNAYNGGTSGKATATTYSYDAMGRIVREWEQTPSASPGGFFVYSNYDLAGNLTDLTYPDGRHIMQSMDGAGRLASVADSSTGTTYLNGPGGNVQYWPSGEVSASTYGNGVTQSFTLNNRLQPCHSIASLSINGSSVSLLDRQSYYNAQTASPCGSEAGNNGNIYAIVDNRQVGLTQSFSYDPLNRITSGSRSDGAYNHTYNYDSFGNMSLQDNLSSGSAVKYEPDPAGTNRLLRSHDGGVTFGDGLTTGDFIYDASGSLIRSADGIGPPHMYQHNALGQLLSIDGGAASYVYNESDQRAFKQTASGTTEYVYFNSQPIAERNNDGSWTDYVYANGQKIAKIDQELSHIQIQGVGWGKGFRIYQANVPISAGDKIAFRQYGGPSTSGGINVEGTLADGQQTYTGGTETDQNGVPGDFATQSGVWLDRVVDLSRLAGGQLTGVDVEAQTLDGADWYMDFADIAVVHADGSVTPIFAGQQISLNPVFGNGTNFSGAVVTDNLDQPAHYYIDDHLGSTQMELSSGGWPVWLGQFTPFGQEIMAGQVLSANLGNPQPGDGTNMHYKFTGKERDAESGLDNFGARYFGSIDGAVHESRLGRKSSSYPVRRIEQPTEPEPVFVCWQQPSSRCRP